MALNKSPTILTEPPVIQVDPRSRILSRNGKRLVSRVVIRAEDTCTGLERHWIIPLDVILEKMAQSKSAEEPCSVSSSGRQISGDWNSHLPSQCLLLLLALCLDLSFMRGNPYRWSAVLQLTSYLTNSALHVSLVKCILALSLQRASICASTSLIFIVPNSSSDGG